MTLRESKSVFRVNQSDKALAPFIELIEGNVLSKSDLSLLTVHTNLLINHAKEEYLRGYNDGYCESKGVSDNVVNREVKE